MTDQPKDEKDTEPGSEELVPDEKTEVAAEETGSEEPSPEETTEVPAPDQPPAPPSQPAPQASAVPPAAPYEPAPPRRLTRRPEGKIIAGVCSGLGAYTGVDPVIWRIGFVVLAFAGGAAIIAYVIAWLVMPMARPGEPLPEPANDPDSSQIGRWVGMGLLAIGVLVLLNGFWHIRGGVFWGLLLLGIGVAIWGRDLVGGPRPRPSSPPPTSPPPSYGPSGTAPTTPLAPPTTPPPPTPPPRYSAASSVPAPSPAARARRDRSGLGRLVVGAAALAIAGALLLDSLDVFNVTPRGMFAVLLAIVGLGLVVGTWFGSARWLIIPGILLVFALAITTFIPLHVRGGFGEVVWSPESRADLRSSYELFAGQAVLDLSKVNFGERDRSVEVDVTFGQLLIVLPEDQPVDVRSKVQGGEMAILGRTQQGWDREERVRDPGDRDLGTLEVDSEVVFGEITVRRVRSSDDFETGRDNNRNFRFGNNSLDNSENFDFGPVLDRGGVR